MISDYSEDSYTAHIPLDKAACHVLHRSARRGHRGRMPAFPPHCPTPEASWKDAQARSRRELCDGCRGRAGTLPSTVFASPVGVARQYGDPALIYRSIKPLSPSRGFVKEHQAACNTGLLVLPSGKRPRECGHEPAMILRWSGRLWPLLFPLMDNC